MNRETIRWMVSLLVIGGLVGPASATLVVQYRADQGVLNAGGGAASIGQNVATWQDQSVSLNHATNATVASQPTLQSTTIGTETKPVVRFDGVGDFLKSVATTGTAGPDSDLTLFAVVADMGVGSGAFYERFVSRDTSFGHFEFDLSMNESGVGRYSAIEGRAGFASAAANGATTTVGQFLVMGATYNGTTDQVSLYTNGVLAGTASYVGSETAADLALYLGSWFYGGTYYGSAKVDLAEFRMYNTLLDAGSLASVSDQLYDNWFGVPEPSTMLLLAVGGGLVWRRRRS